MEYTEVERQDIGGIITSLLAQLKPGEKATVIALSGQLGAGKTTFVQELAQQLGIDESVTSPTYVIEKMYELEGQPFQHLVHIDAYRLESGEELKSLGFSSLLEDPGNLICIEWPERVAGIIPKEVVSVTFKHVGENTRDITISL